MIDGQRRGIPLLEEVAGLGHWTLRLFAGLIVLGIASAAVAAEGDDERRWTIFAGAGIQFDDNVTTDEIDATSNQSDKAAVFEASGSFKPRLGQKLGLEVGYDFFQSLYEDLSDFDLQSHNISASVEREIWEIDSGLNYLYARIFLGGDDFLGLHSATPTLGYSVTSRFYVNLRYNYQNKDFTSSVNDGRDANTHSGTIDTFIFFLDAKGYLSLGYRAEDENTASDEFDYFGHFLHARLDAPIPLKPLARWNPRVTAAYEYSKQDFSNDTASIGRKREDERTTVGFGLSVDLTEHVVARFDYEHIEAISNLSSADFDDNIVTIVLAIRY